MGSLSYIESVETEPSIDGALFEPLCQAQTKLVLLVEDEAFVRKAAAEVLESAGYRLLIAGNASEALEVCREVSEPVDLLLTDVVMPETSGRELAAEFLTICPRAKVLLMSGYPERHAPMERSTTTSGYLAKPFSSATLLQRVREFLDVQSPGSA
jgi:two-component system, cell cycle sensor histidine kinase and response regulator CckA